MASSQNETFGLGGTKLIVGPGATLALYVKAPPFASGQVLKYFTGGSLEIVNAPEGGTLTAAQLATVGLGAGYLMGNNEAFSIEGPARYYLMATGATVTAYLAFSLSSGFTLA